MTYTVQMTAQIPGTSSYTQVVEDATEFQVTNRGDLLFYTTDGNNPVAAVATGTWLTVTGQ